MRRSSGSSCRSPNPRKRRSSTASPSSARSSPRTPESAGARTMSKKSLVPLAAAVLLSSCARHPEDSAKAFIEHGDEHVARGRYNSAIIEYRNAIKELPKSPTAHTRLGRVYVAMAKTQEAYREFSTAAGLDPADAESRIEAGRLLLDAQMNEEAQIRAEQVLDT